MIEGHLLSERYKVIKMIGGGGMANVYLANDTILDREVAIKVLRPEFVDDPEFIERFDREAQAATSLSHPNIVNIYDVGEDEDILYIVMEYVEGMTLKEYIVANRPLPVETAIDIMKQLTNAIAHAHMSGLIHRDIKPQNILINPSGHVKVTDFGIAIALSATSLTQTNSILGSVHYLSPEQARGGTATKKSDIYALGVLFYELLTGEMPFTGQTPVSIALMHLQEDMPSVRRLHPEVPQSVENIVLKATVKDPVYRYETVFQMENDLQSALDPDKLNEPIFVPPSESGEETKVIPVIKDEQLDQQNTLVHEDDETTKFIPPVSTQAPEEVPETKAPKKKKKSIFKRKRFWLTLILLLLIGGAAAAFILTTPQTVKMPDVVGWDFDEAKKELELLKLKVEEKEIQSDDFEEGQVVKTDPKADRSIKEKATVEVFVSSGKVEEEFADYIGKSYEETEKKLLDAGYKEVIPIKVISDETVGDITAQIQPQKGESVVPSETKVIFEISDGPEKIGLMRLTGMPLDEVQQYAKDNDFSLNVSEEYNNDVEKGEVISQDPPANTEMSQGDSIDVIVSLGAAEQPPRSAEVEFSVPYDEKYEDDDKEKLVPQHVQIYVKDKNNDINKVFYEEKITKDEDYELTLIIEPDETAEYKVVKDDKVIIDKSVSYEEGE